MSLPDKGFTQEYYDEKYFADLVGKSFKRPNGTIEHWGYRNPQSEFLGAKNIAEAWKTMFNPKNLLDLGCGRGTFVAYARDFGIEAQGFDYSEYAVNNPYPRCKKEWLRLHDAMKPWPCQNGCFDLVVALDLMEHLYVENIDAVVKEMFRVSRKWIFLQIATVDGVKEKGYILKKGEHIPWEDARTWAGHVTVTPPDFWIEKFEHDEWQLRRDVVNWFCSLVDNNIIKNWLLNTMIVLERI
ncbi:class I SAM-dependent methyltransferase [Candidatus Bathyarchaeota archaeon]|nr:class I SAM-dependent methyltransferase [Candidatus Bathyarchaeota archaeon]